MAKSRLLVVGIGGFGRSVAEVAELSDQFEVVELMDDALPASRWVLKAAVLGPMASLGQHKLAADRGIVVNGNNAVRENLIQQLVVAGFVHATVIHPRAIVSPSAVFG